MRKAILLIISFLFLVGSVTAGSTVRSSFFGKVTKGSGNLETVTIDVDNFSKIKSLGPCDINVRIGSRQSVEMTIDDNLIDHIIFDVRGKTLRIDTEGSFRTTRDIKIDITVTRLSSVALIGSGDIEVTGLDGDFFEFSLSGSGDMYAEGKVEALEVSLRGSGDIDTRELKATEVDAQLSGSGDIRVYASDYFEGSLSGSGDIDYYGNPKHVDRSVSGSGSISRHR